MKSIFSRKSFLSTTFASFLVTLMVVSVASASTTINTNIDTGGTLAVTGATTLSSTLAVTGVTTLTGLSTHTAGFVAQASSTVVGAFTTTGAVAHGSTLAVTGATTLTGLATLNGGASTTALSASNSIVVNGMATTTNNGNIATEGTLKISAAGSSIANMVHGYCTIDAATTITATTTSTVACAATLASGTLDTSHKIFVQATTSLPANFTILAASSTSGSNIAVQIVNTGIINGETFSATPVSLNFFGIR